MAETKIYGLIGYPVVHSYSPAIHNAAFNACGMDASYRLFELKPKDLPDFLLNSHKEFPDTQGNLVKGSDILGFNITIPHKVAARDILQDKISTFQETVQYYLKLSGAINTVKREGASLRCHNTDVTGFLSSLEEELNFDTHGKTVLVIGCGGAGRSVVAGLSHPRKAVEKIYVYENDELIVSALRQHFAQFSHLQQKLELIDEAKLAKVVGSCQLLVNASPLGMRPRDPSPIDKSLLHKELAVYDLIYNLQTQLLNDAKAQGLKACGGLGMLLYQGVGAWELWTGQKAPLDVMRGALAGAGGGT